MENINPGTTIFEREVDTARFSLIAKTPKVKICSLRTNILFFQDEWKAALNNSFEVFVFPNWYVGRFAPTSWRNQLVSLGLESRLDQIHVFINTQEEVDCLQKAGFDAYLVPHNSFLDWNLFRPQRRKIRYNAFLCTRNGTYKHPWLANKVENLAIACNYSHLPGEKDFYDTRTLKSALYEENVDLPVIVKRINQSICTLHTSPVEGGCRASGESLFVGAPVISVKSKGRDYWYTAENSIICEADSESVAKAVGEMVRRHKCGEIDRKAIREDTIRKSKFFRRKYFNTIGDIFLKYGEDTIPETIIDPLKLDSHLFTYMPRKKIMQILSEM